MVLKNLPGTLRSPIHKLISITLFVGTFLYVPSLVDPSYPRAMFLWAAAFASAGLLIPGVKNLFKTFRFEFVISSLFLIALLLVFLAEINPLWDRLYGIYGRNTALLTYISLTFLFLSCVSTADHALLTRIRRTILVTGSITIFLGLLQVFDFITFGWNSKGMISGSLGNSNFYSAFTGICLTIFLSYGLDKSLKFPIKLLVFCILFLGLFSIVESDSNQGLFGFLFGSSIILYNKYVRFKFSKSIRQIILGFTIVVYFLVMFGILNQGPFSFLYQTSTSYRGDYWRSGISMFMDNPVFGVGLDAYGENYTLYRDEIAATRRGPNIVSNAAHNVFIDILASGGFILFFSYMLLVVSIIISSLRILNNLIEFNSSLVGIIGASFAYLLIICVSINQLSIAILGWIIGGLLVGIASNLKREEKKHFPEYKFHRPSISKKYMVYSLVMFAFSFSISLHGLLVNLKSTAASKAGDFIELRQALDRAPQSTYLLIEASKLFYENRKYSESLSLAKQALEVNPKELNAWRMFIASPLISDSQKKIAINSMLALDPHNAEFVKMKNSFLQ